MSQSKTSPRRIKQMQRDAKCLELRAQGMDYSRIAAATGFADKTGAWQAVKRALGELAEQLTEQAHEVRTIQLERLDRMLEGVWEAAASGNHRAIDKVLRIEEARSKLVGTQAATKVEASGPGGEPLPIRIFLPDNTREKRGDIGKSGTAND